MAKHPKRPKDVALRAKLVVDLATGQAEEPDPNEGKNTAAVKAGLAGGAKGGNARASRLTPEERSAAAKHAAKSRWGKAN